MKSVFKPRYKFKFLIDVKWDGEEVKLTKLAPILNQLGIEGASELEEIMKDYFENLVIDDEHINFYASVFLIIWKRESTFTFFSIMPYALDSLIKFWLDKRDQMEDIKRALTKLALKFSYLSSIYWDIEYGYTSKLLKHKFFSVDTFKGTFMTYSKRKKMLGRKTNFKRKIKGKTLDQY